jgi:hypothetical protein
MRSRMMTFVRITQRFAGGGFLKAHGSCDVPSTHFLDLFSLVGVHLQNAAHTLLAALHRVIYRVRRTS